MKSSLRTSRRWLSLAGVATCAGLMLGLPSALLAQGAALRFDGGNIAIHTTVPAQFTNTLEAWIRPTASTVDQVIVGQLSGPNSACGEGTTLGITTGKLIYDLGPAGCGNSNSVIGPAPVPGTWTHLAGTYDGTTSRFYVNGELVGEKPIRTFATSNFVAAGGVVFFDGPHPSYKGDLAEVRLWNHARTAQAIQDSRSCALAGTEPGLVAYWRMNEGSGQLVNDSSPGGFRGVLGTNASPQSNDPTWVTPGPPVSACPGIVTGVTGNPQVNFQGSVMPVTPAFRLLQGMEVRTGAGEAVAAECGDGRSFRLTDKASLFLDGPLCPAAPAGSTPAAIATTSPTFLDLTQGQFGFIAGPGSVTPVVRTPISQTQVGSAGAQFSTLYTVGQATTTVSSGSVTITNVLTGEVRVATAGTTALTGLPVGVPPGGTVVPALAAAILPSSRSVQVGSTATAFATIINAGRIPALVCEISPVTSVPATFTFQATGAGQETIATLSTPLKIEPGIAQNFIIAFTPTAPIAPTDIRLSLKCGGASEGAAEAPVFVGVNTFLLSASPNPTPDIVALAATPGNDGIVEIPVTGTGAFAVAFVNVGVTSAITVSADTCGTVLPVVITLCQTNPASSACLALPAASVTTTMAANATGTFSIFVRGTDQVPFDPAVNRICVRFRDPNHIIVGSTSVAVRTQ